MRLVLAVVHAADIEALLCDFAKLGVSATQIEGDAAVDQGGLAAVILGVDNDQVTDVLSLVQARARARARRVEPLRPIAELAEFWIPGPIERGTGGASVFVLPVRRFERIGYA
ncbi:MAG: cyclic-di-AMP receptor [Chloroflexia bacterium]|nr:cyclic-di-AMP receptor [Chloroflexia bacterium]